jgi:hypothetical protein
MDWTFTSATSPHWSTYAFQVNGITGGGGGGLPFFMQYDLKSGYIGSKSGGFN